LFQDGHIKETFLGEGVVIVVHSRADFDLYVWFVEESVLKGDEGVCDGFVDLVVFGGVGKPDAEGSCAIGRILPAEGRIEDGAVFEDFRREGKGKVSKAKGLVLSGTGDGGKRAKNNV
jgi:hypothetical protein